MVYCVDFYFIKSMNFPLYFLQTGLKNKPGYFLTLENPYYVQAWPFQGMFLSEPIRKGHRRKFRRGFNTTAKFKIDACTKFKELVDDVTENESLDESDPYLPNPADAIDVPKNLKGGAEFHCELDEYAAMVQVQILTQLFNVSSVVEF